MHASVYSSGKHPPTPQSPLFPNPHTLRCSRNVHPPTHPLTHMRQPQVLPRILPRIGRVSRRCGCIPPAAESRGRARAVSSSGKHPHTLESPLANSHTLGCCTNARLPPHPLTLTPPKQVLPCVLPCIGRLPRRCRCFPRLRSPVGVHVSFSPVENSRPPFNASLFTSPHTLMLKKCSPTHSLLYPQNRSYRASSPASEGCPDDVVASPRLRSPVGVHASVSSSGVTTNNNTTSSGGSSFAFPHSPSVFAARINSVGHAPSAQVCSLSPSFCLSLFLSLSLCACVRVCTDVCVVCWACTHPFPFLGSQ